MLCGFLCHLPTRSSASQRQKVSLGPLEFAKLRPQRFDYITSVRMLKPASLPAHQLSHSLADWLQGQWKSCKRSSSALSEMS
jgi:hypothetical protein